jgi:hypothetical protein
MAGPAGLPVIDTMIGFPHAGSAQYDFIRRQTKDRESKESFEFPVEYMFKDVPKGLPTDDPVSLVVAQMDRFGIEKAIVGYANTRGAEKVLYAGYLPMGLSLERSFGELPSVPLKDDVWPKFLDGNAPRILGLED